MINFPETIWGFKSDANLIAASIPGYSPPCIPPVIDIILPSFSPFNETPRSRATRYLFTSKAS